MVEETGELPFKWIEIDSGCVSQIGEGIVAKTSESLEEGVVDWTNCAICSETPIVSSRFEIQRIIKVVSADVIVGERWAVVSFRRITNVESNQPVLRQEGEIEISHLG